MTTLQLIALIVVMGLLGFLLAIRRRIQPPDVLLVAGQLAQRELEVDAQRKTIDFQRKEIARLEKLNTDQDRQIRELLASGASLANTEEYARTKREYDQMKGEMDKLGLYFRHHKADEIKKGRHAGMSIADICIMYMNQGQSERTVN